MAKKRNQDYTDDMNRIAETLRNTDGGHLIKNRETFDDAWNDYFEGNTEGIGGRNDLRNQTFQIYAENYPDRLVEGVIPELRGKERARVKGIMREISLKEEKPKKEFNIVAREKGRIVYSRKVEVYNFGRREKLESKLRRTSAKRKLTPSEFEIYVILKEGKKGARIPYIYKAQYAKEMGIKPQIKYADRRGRFTSVRRKK